MDKKKKITTTVTTTVTEEIIKIPQNEKTHIVCILDRSGSMSSIMDDSIGGFNTFLKQQKELSDDAIISIILFDDKYELIHNSIDIKKVEELNRTIWFPRGTTALYDAIGKGINDIKATHLKLGDEAPEKVLVCIVTDGQENASREYNLETIKKLINESEKNNWNFIYLAANQDAFTVGTSFGVSAGNTYTYTATFDGVSDMSNMLSSTAKKYRKMSSKNDNFNANSKSLIDDDL